MQLHVSSFEVNGGHINLAAPAPENSGPRDVAQCCALALRGAQPPGWSPGGGGIVFLEITLAGS